MRKGRGLIVGRAERRDPCVADHFRVEERARVEREIGARSVTARPLEGIHHHRELAAAIREHAVVTPLGHEIAEIEGCLADRRDVDHGARRKAAGREALVDHEGREVVHREAQLEAVAAHLAERPVAPEADTRVVDYDVEPALR